ncbi:MAG: hypothetical protein U0636_05210 [Phycisphaerales bacterium]
MQIHVQMVILAAPVVLMASCHPTIAVSPTTEGSAWANSALRGERPPRSLSTKQLQLLAAWINSHSTGWEWEPFVTYVPCVYVILKEANDCVGSANICPRRLHVGTGTQYTRSISAAEHAELLFAIGEEAK